MDMMEVHSTALRRDAPWRWPLLALGAALVVWGVVFAPEIGAAIAIWSTSSAYTHGWLILPIALWLGWQRRDRLRRLSPAPDLAAALLVLPLGVAWLVAERLGVMEGRQLAAVGIAVAMVVAILGRRFGTAMAGPLAYLVFLVPFGAFAVPLLQRVTAGLIEFGLGLTDIPHYVDALTIEIPEGVFLVAEACAGLRFLIATIAFGALYALVMFRSPWRRLVVLALSVAVPILANGLRGFGLVVLGHVRGSAAAVDADHVLYGWVFFSLVLLLLILAGLPFREDTPREASLPEGLGPLPVARPRHGWIAAATASVAVLGAVAGPAAARLMDQGTVPPIVLRSELEAPDGCRVGADGTELHCGGWLAAVQLVVFPAGANWSSVVAERRRLQRGGDVDTTYHLTTDRGAAQWDVRQSNDGEGTSAVATWRDGRPAGEGLRDRAAQAWDVLRGAGARPVVVGFTLRHTGAGRPELRRERDWLERILAAQGEGLVTRAIAASRVQ